MRHRTKRRQLRQAHLAPGLHRLALLLLLLLLHGSRPRVHRHRQVRRCSLLLGRRTRVYGQRPIRTGRSVIVEAQRRRVRRRLRHRLRLRVRGLLLRGLNRRGELLLLLLRGRRLGVLLLLLLRGRRLGVLLLRLLQRGGLGRRLRLLRRRGWGRLRRRHIRHLPCAPQKPFIHPLACDVAPNITPAVRNAYAGHLQLFLTGYMMALRPARTMKASESPIRVRQRTHPKRTAFSRWKSFRVEGGLTWGALTMPSRICAWNSARVNAGFCTRICRACPGFCPTSA